MKKKIKKKAPSKNIVITLDELKHLYFVHYGYKVLGFSKQFTDFVLALGIIISYEGQRKRI